MEMRWWWTVTIVGIALAALSGHAVAHAVDAQIEGTDLTISYPDGWETRQYDASPDDIRAFVEAYPSVAAQFGMTSSASDAELDRLWQRLLDACDQIAFDPRDGDTATILVDTGPF